MTDKYDTWGKNWAAGMRAGQSKIAPRQHAAIELAKRNRASGALRPCGVKGCTRHSYRGNICRKHYAMVPARDKWDMTIACWDASAKTAARFHKRFLAELRAKLA